MVGGTPKLFFGAKARPTSGPWQYLYPPGLLLQSRKQGDGYQTVRCTPAPQLHVTFIHSPCLGSQRSAALEG